MCVCESEGEGEGVRVTEREREREHFPHLWMFITSLGRDREKKDKEGGSEREKLMRVIVLLKSTVSALAMTGNKVDSS